MPMVGKLVCTPIALSEGMRRVDLNARVKAIMPSFPKPNSNKSRRFDEPVKL